MNVSHGNNPNFLHKSISLTRSKSLIHSLQDDDGKILVPNISSTIKICGIGGSGCNALEPIGKQFGIENLIAINTDIQSLANCRAKTRIQLGNDGFGTGSDPDIGRKAGENQHREIAKALEGASLLIICAGLGGGTGSGVTPVVARIAREQNISVIAMLTTPFRHEGLSRWKIAEEALEVVSKNVDSYIVIPNEKLLSIRDTHLSIQEAYLLIDSVRMCFIAGILNMINTRGYINVDFADFISTISNQGLSFIGIGYGSGCNAAKIAVEHAVRNSLIDVPSLKGASRALVHIAGSPDVSLHDYQMVMNRIHQELGENTHIIPGILNCQDKSDIIMLDENLLERIQTTILSNAPAYGSKPHINRSLHQRNDPMHFTVNENQDQWIMITLIVSGISRD